MVAAQGLEPRTPRVWTVCSNQLSYAAKCGRPSSVSGRQILVGICLGKFLLSRRLTSDVLRLNMEPLTGVEPVTSSLPRMRSTSWAIAAYQLSQQTTWHKAFKASFYSLAQVNLPCQLGFSLTMYFICDKKAPSRGASFFWLRGGDLNPWPSGYEPDELPAALPRDIGIFHYIIKGCPLQTLWGSFRFPGGGGWIRTSEVVDGRFTVCSL